MYFPYFLFIQLNNVTRFCSYHINAKIYVMIISYDFPAYEPTDIRLIFLITHLFYEEKKIVCWLTFLCMMMQSRKILTY